MKTVLITGGSSGIGFEMSKHWAKAGYHILWASIFQEEIDSAKLNLESIENRVTIDSIAVDLSTETGAQTVYDWVKSKGWQIDVLINNAGFGTTGFLDSISKEKEVNMIQLNVLNLYKMTRLFLPDMRKRNAGTIINISSLSAFMEIPRMTTYASTKAFVKHFSLGLYHELKWQNSKVKVITVFPAAIKDTPFKDHIPDIKTFEGLAVTTAKEVAGDVWKAFEQNKHYVLTGRKFRWIKRFDFLVPDFVKLYFIRKETEIK